MTNKQKNLPKLKLKTKKKLFGIPIPSQTYINVSMKPKIYIENLVKARHGQD